MTFRKSLLYISSECFALEVSYLCSQSSIMQISGFQCRKQVTVMSLKVCSVPSLSTSLLFLRHGPLEERSFPSLCNFQNTIRFGIQGKALLSGNFIVCNNMFISFLCAFARSLIANISFVIYVLPSVFVCVCSHGTNRLPLNGFT
jgi:hypothetical protein